MKYFTIFVVFVSIAIAEGKRFKLFKEKPEYCDSLKKNVAPDAFKRSMSISLAGRAIKRGILKKDSEYIASVIEGVENCSEGTCGLPTLKKLFKTSGGDEAEKVEEPKAANKEDCAKYGDDGKSCIANPSCNFNMLAKDGEGCFFIDENNSPSSEWFENVRKSIFDSNDIDVFEDALAELKKIGSESGACPLEEKIIEKAGAEIIKSTSSSAAQKKKVKKVKKVLKKNQPATKKGRKPNCAKYNDFPKKCVKVKGCKYNLLKSRCKAEGGWFRL